MFVVFGKMNFSNPWFPSFFKWQASRSYTNLVTYLYILYVFLHFFKKNYTASVCLYNIRKIKITVLFQGCCGA